MDIVLGLAAAAHPAQRTTLSLDEDVLLAAKALAQREHRTIGKVISELARQALTRPIAPAERNGIPLMSARATPGSVTLEVVNALRDEVA